MADGDTLLVAGAVAFDDLEELAPIGLCKVVVAGLFVPLQRLIRDGEANIFGLRYRFIDELLAQLIVGVHLDLPRHALRGVDGVFVGGPKHHQGREPEAVERVLRHALLVFGALHHGHHHVEALALVEALFFANAHHGAGVWPV